MTTFLDMCSISLGHCFKRIVLNLLLLPWRVRCKSVLMFQRVPYLERLWELRAQIWGPGCFVVSLPGYLLAECWWAGHIPFASLITSEMALTVVVKI